MTSIAEFDNAAIDHARLVTAEAAPLSIDALAHDLASALPDSNVSARHDHVRVRFAGDEPLGPELDALVLWAEQHGRPDIRIAVDVPQSSTSNIETSLHMRGFNPVVPGSRLNDLVRQTAASSGDNAVARAAARHTLVQSVGPALTRMLHDVVPLANPSRSALAALVDVRHVRLISLGELLVDEPIGRADYPLNRPVNDSPSLSRFFAARNIAPALLGAATPPEVQPTVHRFVRCEAVEWTLPGHVATLVRGDGYAMPETVEAQTGELSCAIDNFRRRDFGPLRAGIADMAMPHVDVASITYIGLRSLPAFEGLSPHQSADDELDATTGVQLDVALHDGREAVVVIPALGFDASESLGDLVRGMARVAHELPFIDISPTIVQPLTSAQGVHTCDNTLQLSQIAISSRRFLGTPPTSSNRFERRLIEYLTGDPRSWLVQLPVSLVEASAMHEHLHAADSRVAWVPGSTWNADRRTVARRAVGAVGESSAFQFFQAILSVNSQSLFELDPAEITSRPPFAAWLTTVGEQCRRFGIYATKNDGEAIAEAGSLIVAHDDRREIGQAIFDAMRRSANQL